MFLKIIWENGGESIVDCVRVRVAPVLADYGQVGGTAIMFEAFDRDDRTQFIYTAMPKSPISFFIMNEKGATIENWHEDRRVALAKGISAPYGQPEPLTSAPTPT